MFRVVWASAMELTNLFGETNISRGFRAPNVSELSARKA